MPPPDGYKNDGQHHSQTKHNQKKRQNNNNRFDFDFIVIGSGFGGSVSAHRLVEKGYRVGVMEMGRR